MLVDIAICKMGWITSPAPSRNAKAETKGQQEESSLKSTRQFPIMQCGVLRPRVDMELEDLDPGL